MRKILAALSILYVFLFAIAIPVANATDLNTLYNQANNFYNNNQPYDALNLYSEGYKNSPTDSRFIDGVLKSQRKILNWSFGSHNRGTYSAAINGYNAVINSPNIDKYLSSMANRNKTLALNGQALYGSDNYFKDGNVLLKSAQPYRALELFSEGYNYYKSESLYEGLVKSGETVLSWSKGSHSRGTFGPAINGYNIVINNSFLTSLLKDEARRLLPLAKSYVRLMTQDEYLSKAQTAGSPYTALDLYVEAYGIYPADSRFVTGIKNSRNTIFSWSKGSHSRGNFGAAINGYNTVLQSPLLDKTLRDQVIRFKTFAEQNKVLYSAGQLLNQGNSIMKTRPYEALQIFKDGLYLYPQHSAEFKLGILRSAQVILSWSKGSHSRGSFSAAISGYQTVINAEYITDSMLAEATINLELAKQGVVLNTTGRYYKTTSYGLTLSKMVDIQYNLDGATSVRSGKAGEPYWVKATPEEIRDAVDPHQVLQKSPYQYLVLSGITGVSVSDLNVLVEGQGVFHNKGQAFWDAAYRNNINEIYLVNHAFLETGRGTSTLAKGVVINGVKVYNVFGIGAYDDDPIGNGAKFAYEQGWTTLDKAIIEGAGFIAKWYINNSNNQQNTLYKMRWNPTYPGTHQYATDIGWAEKQAAMIKSFYDRVKNAVLRFDIPDFN